jgi:glucose/arabinose dehydrogenase
MNRAMNSNCYMNISLIKNGRRAPLISQAIHLVYAALAVSLVFINACGQQPKGKGAGEVESTSDGKINFRVETVAGNLQVPWSIVFTPDGRMLFTERPGRVRVMEKGSLRAEPLATIADVEARGESGLMGLALHPQFSSNHLLYLSYAYDASDGQRIRVVRYRETGSALVEPKLIIENIPGARYHAGCRLRFGPDGKLYITTGDAGQREIAQQLNSLGGKLLRLNDDGTIPQDNPFVGRSDARAEIWTYGHRNSQGIDWQPGSNLLFDTEHGPSGFDGPGGGDEVNIVERGKNYGWPTIHHKQTQAGLESPLLEYTPAVAPASGMFYRGSAFPQFKGNFFFGGLVGERIIRVVLDGRRVVAQESLLQGKYGRIREIAEGPDGSIYFSTSNRDGRGHPTSDDDRILRLVPVKK